MKSQRGFTLVELMVTVTVAAVLLSVAVPSFRNMIINNRLSTISSELSDVISFARSESIKRNRTVHFCKAATANSTSCTAGSAGAAWSHWIVAQTVTSSNETNVISRGSINPHSGSIIVKAPDLSSNRISFSTDGLARSGSALLNNAKIIICSTSRIVDPIRHINIGAASKVTITKDSGECK